MAQAQKVRIGKVTSVLAGATALALSVSAGPAQGADERKLDPGGITIYRDARYNGPAVYVGKDRPDMGLAWRVNSVRVQSGEWELCERTRYRGPCRKVNADKVVLNNAFRGHVVQSIRRVDRWKPEPGGPGNGGASMRGVISQFYPRPTTYGTRVLACATGGSSSRCVAATANRFCTQMGWSMAITHTKQLANSKIYLADVLCANRGH